MNDVVEFPKSEEELQGEYLLAISDRFFDVAMELTYATILDGEYDERIGRCFRHRVQYLDAAGGETAICACCHEKNLAFLEELEGRLA